MHTHTKKGQKSSEQLVSEERQALKICTKLAKICIYMCVCVERDKKQEIDWLQRKSKF